MPKAKHRAEQKDQPLSAKLSKTAKDGINAQAQALGISVNELLERIGRGELSPSASEEVGE
jgi:DNA-binding Lrp family transcriptional regulator